MSVNDDVALARALLDPYLSKRRVGQHLEEYSGVDNAKELYMKGEAALQSATIKASVQKLSTKDVAYWTGMGLTQRSQPQGSGLWCNGSAAIIMSRLTQQPKFRSTLTVVEQGDAKLYGHWWVIANLDVDELNWEGPFGDNAFTIDIWGALEKQRRGERAATCVAKPAAAFYDCGKDNGLTVHCTARPPYVNDGQVFDGEGVAGGAVGRRGRRKCYLTTATCQSLSLADDCDELTTLRWYRDTVLLATTEGRKDVEAYYRSAELIVERIERQKGARKVYERIHRETIRPAVTAIKAGDFSAAYRIYRNMVEELNRRYLR